METTRPPGFPGNPPARMPRAPTPARSSPPRPLRGDDMAFRPTQDVGPRDQRISGLNHAAYGLPVNASRPGSPQAHASLGSGWRPTLAGWDWIPTGFQTRFRRLRHVILSPLTGLFPAHALVHGSLVARRQAIVDPLVLLTAHGARSRHEVESASEVQDEISRRELAGVRASARTAWRRDALALCRCEGRVATVTVRSTP